MRPRTQGFTLVEVLTVVAIMSLLAFLVAPSVNTLQTSNSFNKALNDISLTLSQARLYAMSHNTYVFVGISETNVTTPVSSPQTAATSLANGGRICVGVVATQDGTSGYDATNAANGWTNPATGTTGANLVAIQKPLFFDNLHLTTTVANSGNLKRPTVPAAYQIGDSNFTSYTSFKLPLGAPTTKVTYSEVIEFGPQGQVSLQSSATGGGIAPWIEIGLQPTSSNVAAKASNLAAIQIDGTTGVVSLYRQ